MLAASTSPQARARLSDGDRRRLELVAGKPLPATSAGEVGDRLTARIRHLGETVVRGLDRLVSDASSHVGPQSPEDMPLTPAGMLAGFEAASGNLALCRGSAVRVCPKCHEEMEHGEGENSPEIDYVCEAGWACGCGHFEPDAPDAFED